MIPYFFCENLPPQCQNPYIKTICFSWFNTTRGDFTTADWLNLSGCYGVSIFHNGNFFVKRRDGLNFRSSVFEFVWSFVIVFEILTYLVPNIYSHYYKLFSGFILVFNLTFVLIFPTITFLQQKFEDRKPLGLGLALGVV